MKKIAIYAIARDEEKFVKRWYESIKDADVIVVLDTGSRDETLSMLKSLGVTVKRKVINPWRFDVARNEALKLVPDDVDICLSLDLDEVMLPGWREKILNNWKEGTTRMKYIFNWYIDKMGVPKITYKADKIHARNGYKWIYPVHEVLTCDSEVVVDLNEPLINHFPDRDKNRDSYLPLLKLAVQENPGVDRNYHYLGREYMYHEMWDEAIDMLKKHIAISNWREEKAASMRFIARCYASKNDEKNQVKWIEKSIKEAPYMRDSYVEAALIYFNNGEYKKSIYYAILGLDIKENEHRYINEIFTFDETIYDILSLDYYYLNINELAIYYAKKALEINPDSERIKNNLELFQEKK